MNRYKSKNNAPHEHKHTFLNMAGKIVLTLLVLYAVGAIVNVQITLATAQTESLRLKNELDMTARKKAEMDIKIALPTDNEYILDQAREKFGYVMPGERVFEDTQNK